MEAVNSKITANKINKTIDLLNLINNTYTAECDGYLYVMTNNSAKGFVYVDDANSTRIFAVGSNEDVMGCGLFVKKGIRMTVYDYAKPSVALFHFLGN